MNDGHDLEQVLTNQHPEFDSLEIHSLAAHFRATHPDMKSRSTEPIDDDIKGSTAGPIDDDIKGSTAGPIIHVNCPTPNVMVAPTCQLINYSNIFRLIAIALYLICFEMLIGLFQHARGQVIIQLQNGSGSVATVPGGPVKFKCDSTTVVCSWTPSTKTFFLTGLSSGGTAISHGLYSAVPACSTSVFVYIPTDSPLTYYCNGASSGQWYNGNAKVTPASNYSWSWINQGSATMTTLASSILLTSVSGSGSNPNGLYIAVPSTPYSVTACFVDFSNASQYAAASIFESPSTSLSVRTIAWGTTYFNNSGIGIGASKTSS